MGNQHEVPVSDKLSLSDSTSNRIEKNLSMTPEAEEVLADLSRRTGLSDGNVLRLAIAMLKFAVDAKERGDHVGVAANPEAFDVELVGF